MISAEKIRVDKHFIGNSVAHMRDFVKPLQKLGITSFSYVKLWPGNVESYLTSSPEFAQAYYDNRLYETAGVDNPKKFNDDYLLGDCISHDYIVQAAIYNLHHSFYIIRSDLNTCECFVFSTNSINSAINNSYLNNLGYLNAFADQFKEQATSLISHSQADKNKIFFPTKCEDSLLIPNINRLQPINLSPDTTPLTKREQECIQFIVNGLTAKEIALEIGLSYRTVEKYIVNLKTKFNCKNSTHLAAKLSLYLQVRCE